MRSRRFFLEDAAMLRSLLALLALVLTSSVQGGRFTVTPAPYNPAKAPVAIGAVWSADAGAPSHHALTLAISGQVPFPPGASATAAVSPVEGLKIAQLGFDHKVGTYCTNGSPRWDVETDDGGSYAFGCAAGLHDVNQPVLGWERISFSCEDVQVLNGLPGSCPLGSQQAVTLLKVVQDEAASTTLDNLSVNWTLIHP
jgi:hypothetical protein